MPTTNDIFFSGVNNHLLPVGPRTHVLLAGAHDFDKTVPWPMLWPGLAVLLTTLAFNLFGDSLRDAFDPRGDAAMSGAARMFPGKPFDGVLV